MLKLFVTLLLIVKGITASGICSNRCSTRELGIEKFPETNEDLQKICKPYIEYIECEVQKEEICHKHDPRALQMGYRILATVRESCSEDTLLHAAVVDNLKCIGNLIDQNGRECGRRETQSDSVQQIAEALNEEGLVSLAENGNVTNGLYLCLGLMNFYACQSLVIEKACGTVAMEAFVEIVQKVRPFGMLYFESCDEEYTLLPAVIRVRKEEEEKELSVSAFFRKRK